VRRGEVWWADLRKPVGRRPVLLLSRDSAYRVRRSVTVTPLTRTERRIPTEVALDRSDGMSAHCVVNLDDIATIPRSLLGERITLLNADRMRDVAGAIRFALDLS
jgi:mRNA interferase MazF